ncbi:MAG: hypothetical protein LH473_13730 [Chitinophagales bacterium]|nr:hypothetical protein [Chitinophagales bacterium]
MIHAFLDTKILLDYGLDRKPFGEAAKRIIQLTELSTVETSISSASI